MADPNGPVYPVLVKLQGGESFFKEGLTIRQHFASEMLKSIVGPGELTRACDNPKGMAAIAVRLADALIAELNK